MVSAPASDEYLSFISYRHARRDREEARWMASAIEGYRLPRPLARERGLPRRLGRVFRDEEELAAAPDLGETVRAALRRSTSLVVVCSPRTPDSAWVRREIREFRDLGRQARIFALLVEGEPHESFPPELRELSAEPLAADVRATGLLARRAARRGALLRLVAAITGCTFDELRRRDLERRRTRGLFTGAAIAVALLALGAAGAWGYQQRRDAQATRAQAGREEAASLYLQAERAYQEQEPSRAFTLLARAVRKAPPGDPAAGEYFQRALHLVPLLPLSSHRLEGLDGWVSQAVFSARAGMVIAYADGKLAAWDLFTGRKVAAPFGGRPVVANYRLEPDLPLSFCPGLDALGSRALALEHVGDAQFRMHVWSLRDGKSLWTRQCAILDHTPRAFLSASGRIVLWEDESEDLTTCIDAYPVDGGGARAWRRCDRGLSLRAISGSSDDDWVAIWSFRPGGDGEGMMEILDASTGKTRTKLDLNALRSGDGRSEDGRWWLLPLAPIENPDGSYVLWDLRTDQRRAVSLEARAWPTAISNDGGTILLRFGGPGSRDHRLAFVPTARRSIGFMGQSLRGEVVTDGRFSQSDWLLEVLPAPGGRAESVVPIRFDDGLRMAPIHMPNTATGVVFLEDDLMVVLRREGTVEWRRLRQGQQPHEVRLVQERLVAATFVSGDRIAAVARDGRLLSCSYAAACVEGGRATGVAERGRDYDDAGLIEVLPSPDGAGMTVVDNHAPPEMLSWRWGGAPRVVRETPLEGAISAAFGYRGVELLAAFHPEETEVGMVELQVRDAATLKVVTPARRIDPGRPAGFTRDGAHLLLATGSNALTLVPTAASAGRRDQIELRFDDRAGIAQSVAIALLARARGVARQGRGVVATLENGRELRLEEVGRGAATEAVVGGVPLFSLHRVDLAEDQDVMLAADGRVAALVQRARPLTHRDGDNTARVLMASTGRPLSEPFAHPAPILAARFSDDGEHLWTVAADGVLRRWYVGRVNDPPPEWFTTEQEDEALIRRIRDRWGVAAALPAPASLAQAEHIDLGRVPRAVSPAIVCK